MPLKNEAYKEKVGSTNPKLWPTDKWLYFSSKAISYFDFRPASLSTQCKEFSRAFCEKLQIIPAVQMDIL